MTKIFVLYWAPGSCGDFLQSLLLSKPEEYQGIIKGFNIDSSGRAVPQGIVTFFTQNFTVPNNLWYEINWDESAVRTLSKHLYQYNIKQFVIPTHRYEQINQIKTLLPNVTTIGIRYPKNMYQLVIKNWCKKISANDSVLKQIYNKPLHKKLAQHGVFGEFILSEQLKFGDIPLQVVSDFDININLESIFNQNLTVIKSLFADSSHVDSMFTAWFKTQSILHKYHFDLPELLKNSLGFNSLATNKYEKDIELDKFDNILINHYSGSNNLPTFNTLDEAKKYFKE